MESVVSDWLLTVSTQKAVDMPSLLEGIYHLLRENVNNVASKRHNIVLGALVYIIETGKLYPL